MFSNRSIAMTMGMAALATPLLASGESEKPNIIFYLIEDTSTEYLALYNQGMGAKMENLESLQGQGVRFTRAYSNAPVSSAARTSLITSCFAPRIAGSFHRRIESVPAAEGYGMFPAYLREAGYYTSNANKMDYNVDLEEGVWDDKASGKFGWRKRQDQDQPFFYMYTTAVTHESVLLFGQKKVDTVVPENDPKDVFLAAYHPDTDLMRYTYATFYDQIAKADADFGEMLEQLEADNLMDNTIIFFFGDNGGCVPGTKGYTDNIGLHVPLFVYIPPALQDNYDMPIGGVDDRMVSFIDLGATALSIAGVETPAESDGVPFMGEYDSGEERANVVCYGDRFDDLYAFNRVMYNNDLRYARNYEPYHTQGLHAYYRYKSLALQEWREMYHAGELNAAQSQFFEPFAVEELYDLSRDPHELNNLAKDPAYRKQLLKLRSELRDYLGEKHDLGFIPECVTLAEGLDDVVKYGADNGESIKRYISIADLQLQEYSRSRKELKRHIASSDNVDLWWTLTTLSHFAPRSKEFIGDAAKIATEKLPSYLRSRAVVFLALMNEEPSSAIVEDIIAQSSSLSEVLLVLNDLAYLKECGVLPAMTFSDEKLPYTSKSTEERVLYLNL